MGDSAGELLLDALREIGAHPLRSLLTLTGIVFGAASLVSMTSLAAALKYAAIDELTRMGLPRSVMYVDRGPRSDARGARQLRHHGLQLNDLDALRASPGVASVHGTASTGASVVTTERDQRVVPIEGVDAGYFTLRNWPIVRGREFAHLDIANASRVAVVGAELVRDLFGEVDPIGQTMRIGDARFRVIGIMAPIRLEFVPADFEYTARRVYVPYTYVGRYELGQQRIESAIVTSAVGGDFPAVMRDATALLRRRHGGVEDFRIDNEAAEVGYYLSLADDVLTGWNFVLYAIAGVTLAVGGIGLFSVLLISVRERVREIGIRKALGADDWAIRRLFLAESLTLATLGAGIGVGGGIGLIAVTRTIAGSFGRNFAIPVHVPGTALAVAFAVVVGVVFGWYPARRAARLDPIEAISGV